MKVLLTTLNTKYVHTNIALRYLYETIKKDAEMLIHEASRSYNTNPKKK